MSNTEQLLSGVVGGVIGFFASGFNPAGAFYGVQLGVLAGPEMVSLSDNVAAADGDTEPQA